MSPHSLLDTLNPAQRDAAAHVDGPLLVLAGAGTGKTRVITHRIAHLIQVGVTPSAILGVTFTNKAAREMRGRVRDLTGHDEVRLGTFHGFCAAFLREEFPEIGRSGDFTIYDDADQKALLKMVLADLELSAEAHTPAALQAGIGRWKSRGELPEDALADAQGTIEEDQARVYAAYQKRLVETGACDFDDLLLQTWCILDRATGVAERWRRRITHVLVDEFQDTNQLQYALVRILSGGVNLCVTGDPDQSIYSWRGADPGNFDRFLTDHPDAAIVALERNYRSTGNILRAASEVVRHNRRRLAKTLYTEIGDGDPVAVVGFNDDHAEATAVAQRIRDLETDGVSRRQIAVLYRTNALSLPIERALLKHDVPYQVVMGTEFFARTEVKDLVAYLRFLVNPRDHVSLFRILNVPTRGIGQRTRDRLIARAREREVPPGDLLQDDGAFEDFPPRARAALRQFGGVLRDLNEATELPVVSLIDRILESTGYGEFWARKATKGGSLDPHQNIGQLISLASEHDRESGGGLRDFLEEVALLTDLDRWNDAEGAVSLMTTHAVKGLEFDVVFLIGAEENVMPHAMSQSSADGVEEERRLFHVALTRARKQLVVCHCRTRNRFGRPQYAIPSRFLDEMGVEGVAHFGTEEPAAPRDPAPTGTWVDYDEEHHPLAYLQAGQRVVHADWGEGVVVAIRGRGRGLDRKVVIAFAEDTRRTLVLRHAELEILDDEGFCE